MVDELKRIRTKWWLTKGKEGQSDSTADRLFVLYKFNQCSIPGSTESSRVIPEHRLRLWCGTAEEWLDNNDSNKSQKEKRNRNMVWSV